MRGVRTVLAGAVLFGLIACGDAPSRDIADRGAKTVHEAPSETRASSATGPMTTTGATSTTGTFFRFVAMGDFGDGSEAEYAVARRICAFRKDYPFNLVVTTGDNVYPDGSRGYFGPNFFAPEACLLNAGVRFRSSLGNHDIGADNGASELAEPAFGFKHGRRNYVVRTHGVRIVVADSNVLRRDWLRRATRTQSGDRWKIVVFHHPVYSTGYHGSTYDFWPFAQRLFQRRGVDLVLNGHDHQYMVTKKLHGIRYVVTGGGGAGLYGCATRKWWLDVCKTEYHVLVIRTTPNVIRVTVKSPSGRVIDRFRTTGLR